MCLVISNPLHPGGYTRPLVYGDLNGRRGTGPLPQACVRMRICGATFATRRIITGKRPFLRNIWRCWMRRGSNGIRAIWREGHPAPLRGAVPFSSSNPGLLRLLRASRFGASVTRGYPCRGPVGPPGLPNRRARGWRTDGSRDYRKGRALGLPLPWPCRSPRPAERTGPGATPAVALSGPKTCRTDGPWGYPCRGPVGSRRCRTGRRAGDDQKGLHPRRMAFWYTSSVKAM